MLSSLGFIFVAYIEANALYLHHSMLGVLQSCIDDHGIIAGQIKTSTLCFLSPHHRL